MSALDAMRSPEGQRSDAMNWTQDHSVGNWSSRSVSDWASMICIVSLSANIVPTIPQIERSHKNLNLSFKKKIRRKTKWTIKKN